MSGVPAGNRDRLITIQRPTTTTDDYGGETPAWADLEQAWAQVRFGNASEQRRAAQEGAEQTATFEVLPTPVLSGTKVTDRIFFDGSPWDLTEVAPLNSLRLRFTATRSV